MVITKVGESNTICGGISYDYDIEVNGSTVAEVLEEIKEYTRNDKSFGVIGEYGCDPAEFGNAWGIYIDGKTYISKWLGDEKTYKGDCTEKVEYVKGRGGWYCGINIDILTEDWYD